MKKIIKIASAVMFFAVASQATEGSVYDFKDNAAGGLVGTSQTYVYKVTDDKQIKTNSEAKMAAKIAQKKVCNDPDIKSLIDIGLKVKYIYVSPKKLAIIYVDSCN